MTNTNGMFAGYTVGNDISTRKWQGNNLGSGQWCFSKSFDTFAPLGPCLVSPALIKDPNQLKIKTTVNGKVMQDSSTSDMIFNVPRLVSIYLSFQISYCNEVVCKLRSDDYNNPFLLV